MQIVEWCNALKTWIFRFGRPPDHIDVRHRVHIAAEAIAQSLAGPGLRFHPEKRCETSIRCDKHEVSITIKVKNVRQKRILRDDFEYAVVLAQCYIDGWVASSKPTSTDHIVKFQSTWTRAMNARFTSEWRLVRDRFVVSCLITGFFFTVYLFVRDTPGLVVAVYECLSNTTLCIETHGVASSPAGFDDDDFEYDDEL